MLADECQTYVQILRRLPVPAVCQEYRVRFKSSASKMLVEM
jgi:hypothetical protein